jgi:hypothetical protein
MAGLALWSFYFKFFDRSSGSVSETLPAMHSGKTLIVSDRLSAHRTKVVRDHLASLEGRIAVEYLPARKMAVSHQSSRVQIT